MEPYHLIENNRAENVFKGLCFSLTDSVVEVRMYYRIDRTAPHLGSLIQKSLQVLTGAVLILISEGEVITRSVF